MPRAALIVCGLVFAGSRAIACPDPGAVRARLDREAHRARVWDVAWGTAFGVAAIGQGAMAETRWEFGLDLDDHKVDGLWSGAVQAGISGLSHLILPLHVVRAPVPVPGEDPCKAYDDAARAYAETAAHERTAFWLSIAGGVVLNGGGLLYLGLHDHAWGDGALGLALGVPVAIAHAWTLPRLGELDVEVTVGAMRSPAFTGLVIGGSF